MFERFTDRARRVLVLAQEEARLLNHGFLGTEHLLLGLLHDGDGVAAKALQRMGVSVEAVRAAVEEAIGPSTEPVSGAPPFTPRAKTVLELSLREALRLRHNYIGTEHMLLGLVREGEGVATQVLVRLGADLDRVRQAVLQELDESAGTRDWSDDPATGRRDTKRLLSLFVNAAANLTNLAGDLARDVDGLTREAEDLRAEVARLRAVLEEHSVDPGPAPAGAAGAGGRSAPGDTGGDAPPAETLGQDQGEADDAPPSPS